MTVGRILPADAQQRAVRIFVFVAVCISGAVLYHRRSTLLSSASSFYEYCNEGLKQVGSRLPSRCVTKTEVEVEEEEEEEEDESESEVACIDAKGNGNSDNANDLTSAIACLEPSSTAATVGSQGVSNVSFGLTPVGDETASQASMEKSNVQSPKSMDLTQKGASEWPRLTAQQRKNKTIMIFYGSQTGTAESFAENLAVRITESFPNIKVQTVDLDDFDPSMVLDSFHFGIFVVATFGSGEPTDNAKKFSRWLTATRKGLEREAPLPLTGYKFALCGLGDTNYANFNAFGRKVDSSLVRLGAERLCPKGECDDSGDSQAQFVEWRETLLMPAVGKHVKEHGGSEDDESEKKIQDSASRENRKSSLLKSFDSTVDVGAVPLPTSAPAAVGSSQSRDLDKAAIVDSRAEDQMRYKYGLVKSGSIRQGSIMSDYPASPSLSREVVAPSPSVVRKLSRTSTMKSDGSAQQMQPPPFRLVSPEDGALIEKWKQLKFRPKGVLATKYLSMRKCEVKEVRVLGGSNEMKIEFGADQRMKTESSTNLNEANWTSLVGLERYRNVQLTIDIAPKIEDATGLASEPPASYRPGGTIEFMPRVPLAMVDFLATCLYVPPWFIEGSFPANVSDDREKVCLQSLLAHRLFFTASSDLKVPLPNGVSVGDILKSYFDFFFLPTTTWLSSELLSWIICSPGDVFRIAPLLTLLFAPLKDKVATDHYTVFIKNPRLTAFEVLRLVSSIEGVTIQIPFLEFLQKWPKQKPRAYTIASSPLKSTNGTSLDVVYSKFFESRPPFPMGQFLPLLQSNSVKIDLSSDFLETNKPYLGLMTCRSFGPSMSLSSNVFDFAISPSQLSAITDSDYCQSAPGIWVCAGTGIAPFRSFYQHRLCLREGRTETDSAPWPETHLFFGIRTSKPADHIYADELRAAVAQGALTSTVFAFSREDKSIMDSAIGWPLSSTVVSPDQSPMREVYENDPERPRGVYVQSRLEECKELVWDILEKRNGYLAICGLTRLGKGCLDAVEAIAKSKGLNEGEFTERLKMSKRLYMEVWQH